MGGINNGVISISKELQISPGFKFEEFKKTKYYKNQDGIRIIYLEGYQVILGRKYIVSLFFRNNKIYMISLICCDNEFLESEEYKRKELHDNILKEWRMENPMNFSWGRISSDYDIRGNVSSINIQYA